MQNYDIYFSLFSEIIYTILKIFSKYGLMQCRLRLLLKNRVLEFWPNFFGQVDEKTEIYKLLLGLQRGLVARRRQSNMVEGISQ